jgi:modulator of FtsH protease
MSGYAAGEWNDFCIAILGAAAALSGLLFASVSINIERIMADTRLPARAGQTLILFVTPFVLSTCVLISASAQRRIGRRAHPDRGDRRVSLAPNQLAVEPHG